MLIGPIPIIVTCDCKLNGIRLIISSLVPIFPGKYVYKSSKVKQNKMNSLYVFSVNMYKYKKITSSFLNKMHKIN